MPRARPRCASATSVSSTSATTHASTTGERICLRVAWLASARCVARWPMADVVAKGGIGRLRVPR
eukprot:3384159-Prymnesium_polylepis.1